MLTIGGKSGTEVMAMAELLVGFGSASFCVTVARLVMSPKTPGLVTKICTVALLAGPKVPRLHLTRLPTLAQLPWLVVAETKETLAGRKLDKITPVAAAGPGLKTVRV